MTGWTTVLGLMAGIGMVLLVEWRRVRTPYLEARVAPQIGSRIRDRGPGEDKAQFGGVLGGIASVVMKDAVRLLERWGSPTTDLAARLRRAGSPLTVAQFRAEQVVWGVAGVVVGLAFAGALASRGGSLVPLAVMAACCGLVGGAFREQVLARTIRRREDRLALELPTVADMLALAVSAGEGATAAIERITRTGSGVLAGELGSILGETRTGTPLAQALHGLAERTGVAALSRFATGVAIAVERGTPLADVLHAQAIDVREAGRRRLIEEGGKREIAMMVPVIFLLLPVTVVFAVFPGIVAIRLGP